MNATATYTRKRPVAGIGFGQRGYAGNRHFSSLELARAAFEKYCESIREAYGKPGRNWTGKYVEQDLPTAGTQLVAAKRFTNLKKNGKTGAVVHHVHLYEIDGAQADRYMADLFYQVEA